MPLLSFHSVKLRWEHMRGQAGGLDHEQSTGQIICAFLTYGRNTGRGKEILLHNEALDL